MRNDLRDKIWELAVKNPEEAYSYAAEITDDWYRSQAVAMVAWYTNSKPRFLTIAAEAIKASQSLSSPNRRVTCFAWILKTIAERRDLDLSDTIVWCLEDIRKEKDPVRRADALMFIFEAIYSRPEYRNKIFGVLNDAIEEMNTWKKDRILGDLALVVAKDDRALAIDLAHRITKKALKNKIISIIEEGVLLGPHDFFPKFAKPAEAQPVR